jgi:hypothetical protein
VVGSARQIALVVPPLGCALLAVLAIVNDGAFRFVVHEDSVLEWGEVAAYAIAAVTAVQVARRTDGIIRLAYLGLLVAVIGAIGEELSWGQRLFDVATPERIAAANGQGELNAHNLVGAESPTRVLLLAAGLYGAIAPFVLRPGPLVPPRPLVVAFAVVFGYFGLRLAFVSHPTYAQAKFSEWPEFCFAAAVALASRTALLRVRQGRAEAKSGPLDGDRPDRREISGVRPRVEEHEAGVDHRRSRSVAGP